MAASTEKFCSTSALSAKDVFVMISCIPASYHACDLRIFFIQFVEAEAFCNFHYKHRPMKTHLTLTEEAPRNKTDLGCDDDDDLAVNYTSETDSTRLTDLPGMKGEGENPLFCAVARVKQEYIGRLVKAYHKYHWVDSSGEPLKEMCIIHPIYTVMNPADAKQQGLDPEYVLDKKKSFHKKGLCLPVADLKALKEMKSPDIMPQGNIGTPTQHFVSLINTCRLPPVIVKKLGLKFQKLEGSRMYSAVPFSYTGKNQGIPAAHMTGPALAASGKRLLNHEQFKVHQRQKLAASYKKSPPREKTSNDDDEEEWDRHAAFNDDPSNYERNKERLFEEEIEVKWEKGGSGLVFYTDAQFWKEFEGDFDEQTADDWDVDISGYYETGAGDKDARDYLAMRAERRVRDGKATTDETSAFDTIGKFEKHTKGVGRKVLEKQGWKEGEGVGKSVIGRSQAVESEGQHPKDKKGLGYFGEKVNRYVKTRKRPADQPIISTIYDNPIETDEPDTLLERKNPHNLKHRIKKVT